MTTDALLTQRTFCKEVLEHQADYALPVKENHKQMYDDIQQLFEPLSEQMPQRLRPDALKTFTPKNRTPSYLHPCFTRVDHHTHPNRKHIAHRLHQMARNRSGLSMQRENTKTAQISSQTQLASRVSHPKSHPQKTCSNSDANIGR